GSTGRGLRPDPLLPGGTADVNVVMIIRVDSQPGDAAMVVVCANLPVTRRIPRRSEYPELINCHERSQRIATQSVPLVNGFFRPEEKYVVSGKYCVIPPLCCWN